MSLSSNFPTLIWISSKQDLDLGGAASTLIRNSRRRTSTSRFRQITRKLPWTAKVDALSFCFHRAWKMCMGPKTTLLQLFVPILNSIWTVLILRVHRTIGTRKYPNGERRTATWAGVGTSNWACGKIKAAPKTVQPFHVMPWRGKQPCLRFGSCWTLWETSREPSTCSLEPSTRRREMPIGRPSAGLRGDMRIRSD